MLKQNKQLELSFSKYTELYDIVISSDNFWKQLNDMVDFSFVYEELKDKYSSTMGRTSEDVIRMFKYLLLKNHFKLSDRGLIERTKTDLLFKYFLGYDPEETKLINPSLLTVFRRERLKDIREYYDNTQKEIANILNVSRSTYAGWENGIDTIPLLKLNDFCNHYNTILDSGYQLHINFLVMNHDKKENIKKIYKAMMRVKL